MISASINRKIAREAAEWLMRLGADDVNAADVEACERWRAADCEHERAWQRAQQIGARLGSIPSRIGMATLARPDLSRRETTKLLGLLIAAAPAVWMAAEVAPWREWRADMRTTTGERRQVALPDGSVLHLNTASSVDLQFDDQQRLLILRAGEILIETAADSRQPTRPFRVSTSHGILRAVGTRFSVRELGDRTFVAVFDGAVEIRPNASNEPLVLQAGEQTSFDARGVEAAEAVDIPASDWSRGLLHADHMPLKDFLAELSRHRRGLLRCDPAVAQLPVSGIYQLGDTEAVLRALPELLPVRVSSRTALWVVVEPADG